MMTLPLAAGRAAPAEESRTERGAPVARGARRFTSAALVLLLLGFSAFVVWSTQSASDAASGAVRADRLADDYAKAATAVGALESLTQEYRLAPAPAIRGHFNETSAALVAALGEVKRDGSSADVRLVNRVLRVHRGYLRAATRQFDAVDRGGADAVLRIDRDEEDPAAEATKTAVLGAAAGKYQLAARGQARMQRLQAHNRLLTPVVFLAGLLLAAILAAISRGSRVLDVERARAAHNALHDTLTGLPNRTLLAQRLEQELQAENRPGRSTGLLLIDLDRFKEVNDTFGHRHGDELLRQIGPRLATELREIDIVARLGGDEFAVVLPDIGGVDAATTIAGRLVATLETPFQVEGIDLHVEASVGVVSSDEHGNDPTTLLQRADIAMYMAKTRRPGVFAYDPAVDEHSPARLALYGELRQALARGELVLYYQPQVSISTGAVVAAEALVRWLHPARGLIPPNDFIPLAERTGLIGPLTQYVLDAALAQSRSWLDDGCPLPIAVNLSARNLLDQRLPDQVAALLAAHRVPAALLEIEITESALMTDPMRAQQMVERLSALGFRLSIDDFGTGYTSLNQLKTLPVSTIKIDRSFVTSMTEDRRDALIVHSIIELGHDLGMSLVAEGVEDEKTLTALSDLGCDVAQGYHLSRPLPAAAFDNWRAERIRSIAEPSSAATTTTHSPHRSGGRRRRVSTKT
jgi:diguanylate cyclase (GGDEF)-like protein